MSAMTSLVTGSNCISRARNDVVELACDAGGLESQIIDNAVQRPERGDEFRLQVRDGDVVQGRIQPAEHVLYERRHGGRSMESTAFSTALRGSFMVSTSVCLKSAPRAKSLVDGIEAEPIWSRMVVRSSCSTNVLTSSKRTRERRPAGTERQLLLSLGETLQQDPQPFDELLWIEGLHSLVDPLQRSQNTGPHLVQAGDLEGWNP